MGSRHGFIAYSWDEGLYVELSMDPKHIRMERLRDRHVPADSHKLLVNGFASGYCRARERSRRGQGSAGSSFRANSVRKNCFRICVTATRSR